MRFRSKAQRTPCTASRSLSTLTDPILAMHLISNSSAMAAAYSLDSVLTTHLVPKLKLTELQALRSACRLLRTVVDSAPPGCWQSAAR